VTIHPAGVRKHVSQIAGNPWVRGVASTAATRVGVLIVGLTSTVALARGLGPTGRGIHALAVTLATVGVVALNFGFHNANTYFASRDRETVPALMANTLMLAGFVGVLGALMLAGIRLMGVSTAPLPFVLVVLVVAWLPIGLTFIQLQPLLVVVERLRLFNVAEAGWQLTGAALVLLLWAEGRLTPTTAFGVTLAALVAGTIAVMGGLRTAWRRMRPSRALFRRALPYAARSYGTTIIGLALIRLDIFLVEAKLGTSEVGLYAVAVSIGEVIMIVPATIGALLLPRLAGLTDEGQRWAITRRVLLVTAAMLSVICMLVAAVAAPAIRMIYGEAFLPSTTPLYWLLPGIGLLGLNGVLMHYLLAVGLPPRVVAYQAMAVALNIALELVLLDRLGLAGAGIASTIAYAVTFCVSFAAATGYRRRVERSAQP
jgi:O-antigen/teichoic acid export membrane protein